LLLQTLAKVDTKVDGLFCVVATLGVGTFGKVALEILGLAEAKVHVGLLAGQRGMLRHHRLEAGYLSTRVNHVELLQLLG
jgi:hypothetical protein